MATMNDVIRIRAGRVRAEATQATPEQPDAMTIARRYAEVLGISVEDALERVNAWSPRVPDGAAGAGTQNPPARRPTMNDIIRFRSGRG